MKLMNICRTLSLAGFIAFGALSATSASAGECVAHSSRGPSYDAPAQGNTIIDAQEAALNRCGPNCNGSKGNLVNYTCVGFQITCTAHSDRGPQYDAPATGMSDQEAEANALNRCGPNCNGSKGNLASYTCDDGTVVNFAPPPPPVLPTPVFNPPPAAVAGVCGTGTDGNTYCYASDGFGNPIAGTYPIDSSNCANECQ